MPSLFIAVLLSASSSFIIITSSSLAVIPTAIRRNKKYSLFLESSCSDNNAEIRAAVEPIITGCHMKKSMPRVVHSFVEARRIARGHGFSSLEEFLSYDCPGAYQVPKNSNILYEKEWKGWDDFLGLMLDYETARKIIRQLQQFPKFDLQLQTQTDYLNMMENKGKYELDDDNLVHRLPYRPDLHYLNRGWISWEHYLHGQDVL